MFLSLRVVACFFPFAVSVVAAEDVAAVLARMDKAGLAFQSMTARLSSTEYTASIKDTSTSTGTIRMLRSKGQLLFLADFTKPDPSSVAFHDKILEVYYPRIATVHEYKLGKYGRLMEQLLLLGFGSSTKQLKDTYTITLIGSEPLLGLTTSHLELIPKDKEARQQVPRIGLWIHPEGYPLRQQIYEPSGNYRAYSYEDIKINPAGLSAPDLKLNLPKDVKREYPGR